MFRVSTPSFFGLAIAALLSALPSSPAVAGASAQRKAQLTNQLGNQSRVGTRAVRIATNGILTVSYSDTTGQFSIRTGENHPQPNETVFFPVGTSYITLRDVGGLTMWVNDNGVQTSGLAGYNLAFMLDRPFTTTNIPNGFRTVYSLPNFEVTQEVVIRGTTLSDTTVMHQVRVRNTTGATRSFGLRYMWDWQIAGNDAAVFRRRSPDSAFTDIFQTFANPNFSLYEEVDDPASPTFSIFGSVRDLPLSPAPTTPDQVRYSDWEGSFDSAWDFANTGSADDSAVLYYWGFNTPLSLASGATATFTQYATTQFQVFAQGPTITSFTPTSGPTGTLVTVTGTGFANASRVTLGGTVVRFTRLSDSQLRFYVPGSAAGRISVSTPVGTGTSTGSFVNVTHLNNNRFTITPSHGRAGTRVEIRGPILGYLQEVRFNGVLSPRFERIFPGLIIATVPAGAASGPLPASVPVTVKTQMSPLFSNISGDYLGATNFTIDP